MGESLSIAHLGIFSQSRLHKMRGIFEDNMSEVERMTTEYPCPLTVFAFYRTLPATVLLRFQISIIPEVSLESLYEAEYFYI